MALKANLTSSAIIKNYPPRRRWPHNMRGPTLCSAASPGLHNWMVKGAALNKMGPARGVNKSNNYPKKFKPSAFLKIYLA